ncbi:MAG: NAD(P)/FAD-dependent oxidoreductase [Nitrospirae bacterium]|nr:NAD(P)/FAD-dependent oxidoreductase [Nitrospirota bacterium]
MDEVDITIIGAGVVGLAIAAELSGQYDNIIVLERHPAYGRETSSRNSEVMHAGIYYPNGSLKARLCVEGLELLYGYCERHSIPHSKIGKLIVATEQSEFAQLEELMAQGLRNGVSGLSIIDGASLTDLEPNVAALAAIYSPRTGIIDSHSLMKYLYADATASGVTFSFGSEVDRITPGKDGNVIGIRDEDYNFSSKVVINSAGLFADRIAGLAGIDIEKAGYKLSYYKGSYFSYSKASPVKRLVYPLPHKDLTGLGVHATLDLAGRLRFGPDAEHVDAPDYTVDAGKADSFYNGASRFIRGLEKAAFVADMAGIRPKLQGGGVRDFIIKNEIGRGMNGFINLIGIESPGLTACLSIAKYVSALVGDSHLLKRVIA